MVVFFKYHLLEVQEQALPKCQKSSRKGRRPAWLSRDLLLELRQKMKVYGLWKQGQVTWEDYMDDACLVGRDFVWPRVMS